jgi:adenine-specific DNA-methyltransferase
LKGSLPVLNWVGKESVVNHDKEVPFRLLKPQNSDSVGSDTSNKVIHGDNLEALKALLPEYLGRVKCVYIDPPYNTGNEKWVYNDNVNSPAIQKWLKKVVGSEGEDLCRHDKWLCMMYPRLKLLRELLSDDGVICISCDDKEYHNLRLIMDELFLESNFIGYFIWKKKGGASNTEKVLGIITEFILVYSKDKRLIQFNFRDIDKDFKHKDENGFYNLVQPLKTNKGEYERKTMQYGIRNPETSDIIYPPQGKRWTIGEKTLLELLDQDLIVFQKDKDGKFTVYIKEYSAENDSNGAFLNLLINKGSLKSAKNELEKLNFDRELFDTPKPTILIRHLLDIISSKNDIILDSFAGSGTTGHAVMDLNKEDGGNRKFILIEMLDEVAKPITLERLKRAKEKYGYKDEFTFYELEEPLLTEEERISPHCSYEDLATYIFFTQTNAKLDMSALKAPFIGTYYEREYFLFYAPNQTSSFTKALLKNLPKSESKKVIYADRCLVSEDILEKHNITFKQIPYELKVF